jgi:putative transposase
VAREATASFIHELRLLPTPAQSKVLDVRLNISRQIYNACLGEALKRLRLVRQSKEYTRALKLPKKVKGSTGKLILNKERSELFKASNIKYRFREYDLHAFVKYQKTLWITDHVDSHTAQKLATRAFKAVQEYAIGKRGKPRFRGANRFASVEGKSNAAGIRWDQGRIKWLKGVEIKAKFDLKDKHGLEAYALSCRTKYVRLVRRVIKGNAIWYAQLVQEGTPYIKGKNTISKATVGLDIGPSTIAVVGEEGASLQAFCPEVDDYAPQIKQLQRHIARSMRLNNPANYAADRFIKNANGKLIKKQGKSKKGCTKWHKSNKYLQLQAQLAELSRKMASARKASQGKLANNILKQGRIIKTEKLSYKGFQKNFGKSIGKRAPGLLLEILRRKAANAGGEVIEFNTRTTALSQSCQCGNRKKKALKDRWHECHSCGIKAQRDLYSAYLACFVQDNRLDAIQAQGAWTGVGILLEQAVSNLKETTTSKTCLASFGLNQRQSCLSVKEESMHTSALNVVAIA